MGKDLEVPSGVSRACGLSSSKMSIAVCTGKLGVQQVIQVMTDRNSPSWSGVWNCTGMHAVHDFDQGLLVCRSSGSENSMVVVTKEAKSQQATNKMREELERVNSDLAHAMKGLQEVSVEPPLDCGLSIYAGRSGVIIESP